MNGHVKITKLFADGKKELVCEDHNILTDGLGVGIVNLFSDSGSSKVKDHLIGYFQVGSGAHYPDEHTSTKSKYFSTLQSPFSEKDYGSNAETVVAVHELYRLHSPNFVPSYQTAIEQSPFVALPASHRTTIVDGVVDYRLTITENMCNGKNLSEFGLYIRDALINEGGDQSVLAAYKNFPVGQHIEKTSDFAVQVDWQLKFIDTNSETNPYYVGSKPNVVFIMIDDVGLDYLPMYDDQNDYQLSGAKYPTETKNPNANAFSPLYDSDNGCGIYPHVPTLSAICNDGMRFNQVRSQAMCSPTRAVLLTGKYNFSCRNAGQAGVGFWGPGYGKVVSDNNSLLGLRQRGRRARSGLAGLNHSYAFLDKEGSIVPLEDAVKGYDDAPNKIASQKLFAEYMKDSEGGMNYQAAMFGKWHLALFDEATLYCEDGGPESPVKGYGWGHIADVGKWDHYSATWSNLNGGVQPGFNFDANSFTRPDSWPQLGGSTSQGTDMGYVNYFINVNGQITSVSDAGYVGMKPSLDETDYGQGEASSYATNKILAEASGYFNTAQEPFFMYISPNMPHTPYTYPPSGGVYTPLYNQKHQQMLMASGLGTAAVSSTWMTTNAMLENFDRELSSFITNTDAARRGRTVFIITADNGSNYTDVKRRNNYCSGILQTSAGLGGNFVSALLLKHYASGNSPTPSAIRRGGDSDSGNNFKASQYDRGIRVPLFASGPNIPRGQVTNALVDLNDILATVVDIAGGDLTRVPSDSISFKDILYGLTDSSGHERQYSYSEIFFPLGAGLGNSAGWGSYTGENLGCLDPTGDETVLGLQVGDPVVPRRMRRSLICRWESSDFYGFLPQKFVDTAAKWFVDNPSETYPTAVKDENIPDVSAGLWKMIRPSGGGSQKYGGGEGEVNPGKGKFYNELYHLESAGFNKKDPWELTDYVLEKWKGVIHQNNFILSSIIVSAINVAGSDRVLDNTNYYWNLARIYDATNQALAQWIQFRKDPQATIAELCSETISIITEQDENENTAATGKHNKNIRT